MKGLPLIILLYLIAFGLTFYYFQAHQKISDTIHLYFIADYGRLNQTQSNPVFMFNALNHYSINDYKINFIVSGGDNIFPQDINNPQIEEIVDVIDLFREREGLNKKDIYAITGNEDVKVSNILTDKFRQIYPYWKQPYDYYYTIQKIPNSTKKVAFIFLETTSLVCQDPLQKLELQCQENINFNADQDGQEQIVWLRRILRDIQEDGDIVWRIVFGHHELFSKRFGDSQILIDQLIPMFLRYGVQIYINGHVHAQEYIQFDTKYWKQNITHYYNQSDDPQQCLGSVEQFFFNQTQRELTYTLDKDKIHFFTSGNSGSELMKECLDLQSQGEYMYLQNKYFGFSDIHINEDRFRIKFLGVDPRFKNETQVLLDVILQQSDRKPIVI